MERIERPYLPQELIYAHLLSLRLGGNPNYEFKFKQHEIRRIMLPVICLEYVNRQIGIIKKLDLRHEHQRCRTLLIDRFTQVNRKFLDPLKAFWGIIGEELDALEEFLIEDLDRVDLVIDNGTGFLKEQDRILMRSCFLGIEFSIFARDQFESLYHIVPEGKRPSRAIEPLMRAFDNLGNIRLDVQSEKDVEVLPFWKKAINDQLIIIMTKLLQWSEEDKENE